MRILPAIDLLNGRAVRLTRGERRDSTVYHSEPWVLAREFSDAGAERIHVVDLNGAFEGARHHSELIQKIVKNADVPVQVGGGIRKMDALESVFASGARFAVLGTAAWSAPEFAETACRTYPGQIVVAVDARGGMVAVEGWQRDSGVPATELAEKAAGWGAAALLYTDVERDGTGDGPAVTATARLAEAAGIPVIASGGIGSLDHIRALARERIPMAVVGRALYEKKFSVAEAIAAASSEGG